MSVLSGLVQRLFGCALPLVLVAVEVDRSTLLDSGTSRPASLLRAYLIAIGLTVTLLTVMPGISMLQFGEGRGQFMVPDFGFTKQPLGCCTSLGALSGTLCSRRHVVEPRSTLLLVFRSSSFQTKSLNLLSATPLTSRKSGILLTTACNLFTVRVTASHCHSSGC
jgi:hypothetical protein